MTILKGMAKQEVEQMADTCARTRIALIGAGAILTKILKENPEPELEAKLGKAMAEIGHAAEALGTASSHLKDAL